MMASSTLSVSSIPSSFFVEPSSPAAIQRACAETLRIWSQIHQDTSYSGIYYTNYNYQTGFTVSIDTISIFIARKVRLTEERKSTSTSRLLPKNSYGQLNVMLNTLKTWVESLPSSLEINAQVYNYIKSEVVSEFQVLLLTIAQEEKKGEYDSTAIARAANHFYTNIETLLKTKAYLTIKTSDYVCRDYASAFFVCLVMGGLVAAGFYMGYLIECALNIPQQVTATAWAMNSHIIETTGAIMGCLIALGLIFKVDKNHTANVERTIQPLADALTHHASTTILSSLVNIITEFKESVTSATGEASLLPPPSAPPP
jgi:hypothetical protein